MKADRPSVLGANRLLAALEPSDLATLAPSLESVALPAGKILYESGEVIDYAFFPQTAMISVVAVMKDGHSAEMAVVGREGVLGYAASLVSRAAFGRYIVQLPGTSFRIPVDKLQEALDASESLRRLFRCYLEALLVQTFQTVACNAVHSVEARCCRWVLATHDRQDGDDLPLTHEFLAEMLSVQRSTVSLVTRTLQIAGLIEQRRGAIRVVDRNGLEEIACECYGTVRRRFNDLLPLTYSGKGSKPGSLGGASV